MNCLRRLSIAAPLFGAVVATNSALAQTAADSLALADALTAVLVRVEVSVRPLPPDTPNPWETRLLERLWDADLPEPYDRYHWLQLRASRLSLSGDSAEVAVDLNACVSGEDGEATSDGHVRIHIFERSSGGWEYVNAWLYISGAGTCDPAGPIAMPPRGEEKDFVTAVDSAVRQAILAQTGNSVQGPLYLDLESLQAVAGASGVDLGADAVSAAWSGRTGTQKQVIQGDYAELEEHGELQGESRGMWIPDDGVHIEADELSEVVGGYNLTMSYLYNSEYQFRGLPTLGCATLRLKFRYEKEGLGLVDWVTLAVC